METTFTDFFNHIFWLDQFQEMAEPLDISKTPYKFDQDDIDFLSQFPRAFQTTAWTRRWHDLLFEALQEREQRRKPVYERAYQRIFPQQLQQFQGDQRKAQRQAQFQAEKIAEREVPNLHPKYDQPMPFTFRLPGRKGGEVTYLANPRLNRLVHKLETTQGEPFHPASGLEGEGQYGYDLWNPRQHPTLDKRATRGFNFVNPLVHGKQLSSWLNYTAHQMLGALPDEGKKHPVYGTRVKWQADFMIRDTLSVDKNLRKVERRIAQQVIPHLENGQIIRVGNTEMTITPELKKSRQQTEQLARLMAREEIIKMARQGQLKTPPSPQFPQGQVIGAEQAQRILSGKDPRAYPPLYVPHHEITAQRLADGRIIPEKHWVPMLLPGKFLRPLNAGDAELPDDVKLGHAKDYVEMPYHRQGTDWLRAGAIHFNQNSTGRQYLDPGDEDYDRRFQELETLMKEGGLDNQYRWVPGGRGYFKDIVDGVRNGILKAVGGMGEYEKQVLWSMFPDLHELAHQRFLENLRDDRLFDRTAKGQAYRRAMVESLVAKYAQQNWGQGLRRTRGRTRTVSGEDVGFGNLLDNARARGRQQCLMQQRGQGGKVLTTGSCEFAYDLRSLETMFNQADEMAKKVDQEQREAGRIQDTEHGFKILKDKGELMMQILTALRNHYESLGYGPTDVQNAVSRDWNQLNAGNPHLEVLAQRFKQEFQQLAQQGAAPENTIQQLQALINKISQNPRLRDDPQTRKRLNQYASLGPEYAALVDRAETQFTRPQRAKAAPRQESFRGWLAWTESGPHFVSA